MFIENNVDDYYLSQFHTPWEWKVISNDMIDMMFTDYYSRYNMSTKLKKILYNIMYNIDLLKKNNVDLSYLYYILFGAYKNLIYLKGKCSEFSIREMNEYKPFLQRLEISFELIDLNNLNFNSELQLYSEELLNLIREEIRKNNF